MCIQNPNIERLWEIFIKRANLNFESTLFLKWVNKERESAYMDETPYIFNHAERQYLFTHILSNEQYVDVKHFNIHFFKCFEKFFRLINQEQNRLELYRRGFRVVDFMGLVGISTLWDIVLNAVEEKVRDMGVNMLVDLHLRLSDNTEPEDAINTWKQFINRCMDRLVPGSDPVTISNTVELLAQFLDRYDGKKPIRPEY